MLIRSKIILFFVAIAILVSDRCCAAPPPAPVKKDYKWLEIPPVTIDASAFQLSQAVENLKLETPGLDQARAAVRSDWARQYSRLFWRIRNEEPLPYDRKAGYHLDEAALITKSDRDPLDVVLRRTKLLIHNLQEAEDAVELPAALTRDLQKIEVAASSLDPTKAIDQREALYLAACAVRRQIAFCNPLLDFKRMLFIARGTFSGSRKTGDTNIDAVGGHFATQYFGFNTRPGGGLYYVSDFRGSQPKVVNLLENISVSNGRLRGKTLTRGAVISPDLSYDGKTVLFAYTENQSHAHNIWTLETTWHIFKLELEHDQNGRPVPQRLTQLTDGRYNDFDPCWLPSGRITFISERRGGYIRCFGRGHIVPSYVLHSMKADGSDLYPLSFFETSEWQPSVNNQGRIVYTRWDYTDRENCLGSNFWICYPDGRDPRAPHGNYPTPFETFSGKKVCDGRRGRPYTEMSIRAIPGSQKYIFTAAPHHGETFGALCMLDLREKDDLFMSQIRKITPYVPFPESQIRARSHYPYGTPWPLSEDFYLVNYWEDVYLLDRYGNRELLVENSLCPHDPHGSMRLCDPIPLTSRPSPPVIPDATTQSEDYAQSDKRATIGVMDVYDTDLPLPKNTKIRWVRVVQNILKTNPLMNEPYIGYGTENTPRIPLGIVPVEDDGSVFFEAPPGKELMFQLLDENKMAVHSMRAVAYVHPGETLTCAGCHEKTHDVSAKLPRSPKAFMRRPSQLQPELDGAVEPITFYRHVAPMIQKSCIPCHQEQKKNPQKMDHADLAPYVFHFDGGMRGALTLPMFSGSRTIPGHMGSRMSKLSSILDDENHRDTVTLEVRARLRLWMDLNGLRLGAFHSEEQQKRGELVWPILDVDPKNPVGLPSGGSYNTGLDTHTHPAGDYKKNREAEKKRLGLQSSLFTQDRTEYLIAAHDPNGIYLVDSNGNVCWQHAEVRHPQDLDITPEGTIFCSELSGAKMIKRDHSILWEYRVPEGCQNPVAQVLKDGRFLVSNEGPGKLLEIDESGKTLKEIPLSPKTKVNHGQFRFCSKTPQGTYLTPMLKDGMVKEYAADGSVICDFGKFNTPVSAIRLKNGNTVIGSSRKLSEHDKTGKEIWSFNPIDDGKLSDGKGGLVTGIFELKNGDIAMAFYHDEKQWPDIMVVNHQKKMVHSITLPEINKVAGLRVWQKTSLSNQCDENR